MSFFLTKKNNFSPRKMAYNCINWINDKFFIGIGCGLNHSMNENVFQLFSPYWLLSYKNDLCLKKKVDPKRSKCISQPNQNLNWRKNEQTKLKWNVFIFLLVFLRSSICISVYFCSFQIKVTNATNILHSVYFCMS